MASVEHQQPFSILIAALGGEGGGVLMNWIVDAARAQGLAVQATSVPGVAQRTGSTSYYIEILPAPPAGSPAPIFALVPMPGRVDVVVASELSEAGRIMERGFVSPTRTTLIMSTSRVYTTAEKMQMGDGRYPAEKVAAAAEKLAKRVIAFDLAALAEQHGTMVSATMFGALAGAGVLPWDRAASEAVVGSGGRAKASVAGFAAAHEMSRRPPTPKPSTETLPMAGGDTSLDKVIALGRERCRDYQDQMYGALYVMRAEGLMRATPARDPVTAHAIEEAARRLALWMAYEDIPRVADLKTRPERFKTIRAEAQMAPGQVLHVTEYMKPGIDELAAMLPEKHATRLLTWSRAGRWLPFAGHGLHVKTTGIVGFTMLKLLSRMKSMRRRSIRYAEEQTNIDAWMQAMVSSLKRAPAFAAALAELPRVLKGYGDTHERGKRAYGLIFSRIVQPAVQGGHEAEMAPALRSAITAALADSDHTALDQLLAKLELGPQDRVSFAPGVAAAN
jgi:indolepyruvate ferredoxin oxidoreductase, beta subunit